ncbi:preprotein translocase subunit SecG [candidate division WOR-1 bacterium RIFOXYA12_FULL_43_27]|uniref:Protein-export membrane protein SecG n=1 Tax=candidate division WOR-1 bacterium RIFOXYC2_FULL_46_14 TaxID=1802587 RepID=A0A1F4U3U6_UNCSA|nr:MAG: preprotein translocase subunit SecG [candidate division WOR-1 bacterium RIFOXYA12_FULL_43_27]OGC20072.1 MAG: preprotein translocase subunit SecG [candidate division WOR-1 bacterium RIFOXYB2_FULL_46_45]OGC32192.1 MAG: preprotein translocase subunit SecG [candidate division WOR-1 bacterium RIFOXYA2_FULL_46_56]OGC39592.1 MAG: preprotein translocase subunit SecG [candidate division WOR-1 bacterium RIFOXYC2_FULL_46_14]
MKALLIFIQVMSAICLVITVILHTAKGEGLGGIGGAAKLFGTPKGLEEGLDKITTTCAVVFLLVSLILGIN